MKKTHMLVTMAIALAVLSSLSGYGQKRHCPTTTVAGHTYTTDPCSITVTMIAGKDDKQFTFSIVPDNFVNYGFSVYGYGFGFPTYSLMSDVSSGGARGTQFITVKIKNKFLPLSYDGKKKVYKGYLPIHIYQGSETGLDTNFLKLPVTVTILPK